MRYNMTRQGGAVLITALIFMVMMSIFAVTALRSSTLNERAAANYQFRTVADQTAELAIGTVLSEYSQQIKNGQTNHIFKQASDAADHQLYFPDSSGGTRSIATLDSSGSLPVNSKGDYRSLISEEDAKYQRAGDDSNHLSMLFIIDGEGELHGAGAKATHRESVSVPLANTNGYTQGYAR